MIAKKNVWNPLLSKTVVKSMAQYRQNESKTDSHEGVASFVRGGTKPFSQRIFRAVFFQTWMPIKLSSSEIRCDLQIAVHRFMSIMRSKSHGLWACFLPILQTKLSLVCA